MQYEASLLSDLEGGCPHFSREGSSWTRTLVWLEISR